MTMTLAFPNEFNKIHSCINNIVYQQLCKLWLENKNEFFKRFYTIHTLFIYTNFVTKFNLLFDTVKNVYIHE